MGLNDEVEEPEQAICGNCKKARIGGDKRNRIPSVECEKCKIWMCVGCEDLSTNQKEVLDQTRGISGLTYWCKLCIRKQQKEVAQQDGESTTTAEKDKHNAEVADYKRRIDELEQNKMDLEEKDLSWTEKEERWETKERQWIAKDEKWTETETNWAEKEKTWKAKEKHMTATIKDNRLLIAGYVEKIENNKQNETSSNTITMVLGKKIEDQEKIIKALEVALDDKLNKEEKEEKQRKLNNEHEAMTVRDQPKEGEQGREQREPERRVNETNTERHDKQNVCNRYAYGKTCRFGEFCRYNHILICKRFAINRKCMYGERCKFSHDISHLCRKENTEQGCSYGGRCRFGHLFGYKESYNSHWTSGNDGTQWQNQTNRNRRDDHQGNMRSYDREQGKFENPHPGQREEYRNQHYNDNYNYNYDNYNQRKYTNYNGYNRETNQQWPSSNNHQQNSTNVSKNDFESLRNDIGNQVKQAMDFLAMKVVTNQPQQQCQANQLNHQNQMMGGQTVGPQAQSHM